MGNQQENPLAISFGGVCATEKQIEQQPLPGPHEVQARQQGGGGSLLAIAWVNWVVDRSFMLKCQNCVGENSLITWWLPAIPVAFSLFSV